MNGHNFDLKTGPPAAAALLTLLLACASADRAPNGIPTSGPPESVASPAPVHSAQPFLAATPAGDLLLSWIEQVSDSVHALRFSRHDGVAWSPPRTVAQGTHWFVNWADFPSIIELPEVRWPHTT